MGGCMLFLASKKLFFSLASAGFEAMLLHP